jgi:hypothetical protein
MEAEIVANGQSHTLIASESIIILRILAILLKASNTEV